MATSSSGLLLGLGLLWILAEIWSHRRLSRALAPRPAPPRLGRYPSVSVIRPIKGLDPGAAENVRAGLDTGYPGAVQTLFVFDDETEPALPIVQQAIDEHRREGRPGEAEIVYCGAPAAGRTGKLNAMIAGLAKAQGELVAFADSDIRTDRDTLRVAVETLLHGHLAGAAFPPVVVSEPAQTFGDAVYALLLNGLYSPPAAVVARSRDGELPFILGQFMVTHREALAAIGGLESVQGQIVDDLYIGQLLRRAGLRNLVTPHPIRIIQYGLRPRAALQICRRWFTFSRTGIPEWSFKLPIATRAAATWVAVLVASAAALSGAWAIAAMYGALAGVVNESVGALHRQVGGAPLRGWHRLAPTLTYLGAPFLLAFVYCQRRVPWRGRIYALDAGGRLAKD